jgi:dolichyl-diphosphooligosaccharide--protein glycosyltransferase
LQRRYGYWAAVSLGILSGYIVWYICSTLSIRQLNRQQKKRKESSINYGVAIISGLVVLLLVFIPLLNGAKRTAEATLYTITPAWLSGLHWLDANTPKLPETDGQIPLGTSEYGTAPTNAAYDKIGGYGIVSWWDYGYWIIHEGKRPAIVHPGGGWLLWTSQFLLCQEGDPFLTEYIKQFKPRYVIIDYQMATGKFYAVPEIAVSNMNSDIAKRIKAYTVDNLNRCLLQQLYYNNKFDKWELIWQSSQTYNRIPEVKIFEYKGT